MPIGVSSPTAIVARLIDPDRNPGTKQGAAKPGIQPLPFAPSRVSHRAVPVVEPGEDGVRVINGLSGLVWNHFCSMASNGEAGASSFDWATPSARAI